MDTPYRTITPLDHKCDKQERITTLVSKLLPMRSALQHSYSDSDHENHDGDDLVIRDLIIL